MKAKHVMITGVTRGLGRAMACKFASLGWQVSGCGRDESAIDELTATVEGDHYFAAADLQSNDAAKQFVSQSVAAIGVPDLLLNNAGLINRNAPLWEVPAEEFSAVVDVNIKGVASMIRHCVPLMIEHGSGVIVNFSSGWGRSTSPEVAPYCATKWAIEGLNGALAQELPAGLAAVALNPGIIDTDILQSCFGPAAASYHSADEWAETAVPFLAELDARCNGRQMTAP